MALEFLLGTWHPAVHQHDTYTIGNQSVVQFYCKGKHKMVRAPLSGSFGISVTSQWKGLFDGMGGGSALVGFADSLVQAFGGHSVSQPWFGRKLWGGTSPFHFSLPLQFVSRFNAYEEVYTPMVGLLSFMYPRLDAAGQKNDVAGVLSTYFVPGPSLFYSRSDPDNSPFGVVGDRVEIKMGSFLDFKGCYLTSMSLTVENSFNRQGYPHSVHAQVDFDAVDVSFVNYNGSFMETGFADQDLVMNKELLEAANQVKEKVDTVTKAGKSLFDRALGEVDKILESLAVR